VSFFGDDTLFQPTGKVKFIQTLKDLFRVVGRAKWKVRVILWDPETGEEWEVTPVGSRRTKSPVSPLKCTVVEHQG